ncbi:hypothetical protein ABEG63_04660 [Chryseobacterium sp. C39-AII1]|uniref:hypothetical protein n=1 Tax=Chryseobacterium sp. C39-AII1 TaxID=3080332 RepID=UPI00320A3A11
METNKNGTDEPEPNLIMLKINPTNKIFALRYLFLAMKLKTKIRNRANDQLKKIIVFVREKHSVLESQNKPKSNFELYTII